MSLCQRISNIQIAIEVGDYLTALGVAIGTPLFWLFLVLLVAALRQSK